MESAAYKDVEVEDVADPIIKMNDPFLEVSIPDNEPAIFQALRYGDIEMVRRQIREGYDINTQFTSGTYRIKTHGMEHRIQTTNYTALHLASLHSTCKVIEELLDQGADVNILDEQKRTPLHFTVVTNRISVLKLLILKGANINLQSGSGRTPLIEAVINREFISARILVDAGADLDLCDTKGSSILHQICFHKFPNMEFLRYILSKNCNVNITNSLGSTPLMFAAAIRNLDVARLLVQHNANINQTDKNGMTALQFIMEHKTRKTDLLLYLIQNGANLNLTNRKGESMLEIAIKNMSLTTIVCLLLADTHRNATKIKEHEQVVYLCERVPQFKEWLYNELDTPRSLTRCCRSAIRAHLSPDRLTMIEQLDIPRSLQDFLLCRDISPQHLDVT